MVGHVPYSSQKWPVVPGTIRLAFTVKHLGRNQQSYDVCNAINNAAVAGLDVSPIIFYLEIGEKIDHFCPRLHISQLWGYTGLVVHTDPNIAKDYGFTKGQFYYCYERPKIKLDIPFIVRAAYYNKLYNTQCPVIPTLNIPDIISLC